jgi:hypothetical protein
MARLVGLTALAALGACVTPASGGPASGQVESVAYETGPCFGACPVYRLVVNADGSGVFEGRRFTSVTGQRNFRVTPGQYRDFVRRLEPLRPASGIVRYRGRPLCEMMATDLPSTDVKWRPAVGREQQLYFYHGCDMEKNRPIAERLDRAIEALPVKQFIRAGE